jgi:deazaflavin-dependent oxidoreductase (nitroreductase family)
LTARVASGVSVPREIAPGVHCAIVGEGFMRSNVYLVQSGSSWALIDTGSASCDRLITQAAESLFGAGTRPASILLTHDHPDHSASAAELAQAWGCPVYVHPDELSLTAALAAADYASFMQYANPLDRWIILPLLRIIPPLKAKSVMQVARLEKVVRALDPNAVPGLPDWQCVPTPGHTPGHVAYFRPSDRVLIAGDAIVTVRLNSVRGLLFQQPGLSGPPWYTTWSWRAAKQSASDLARLEPRILAGGHGVPMTGPNTAHDVQAFAERFSTPQMERLKMRLEDVIHKRDMGLGVWLLRKTKGRITRLWHRRALVLTTRGRKSGLQRSVPLQFFPDGDTMVVVAANTGLPTLPGWYFNLMADQRATVNVEGRTVQVRAEEMSNDEAAGFWPRVLETAPDYAKYPRRTSRRIPLLRLVPIAAQQHFEPQ